MQGHNSDLSFRSCLGFDDGKEVAVEGWSRLEMEVGFSEGEATEFGGGGVGGGEVEKTQGGREEEGQREVSDAWA